ncbi:MAG: class I adenylate-forming enzyme family protein [Thermoplasmata archaeon]
MNIASLLENSSRWWPNQKALIQPYKIASISPKEYTYEELNKIVNRFGNALTGLGIKKEDRVAVFLPNCTELTISWFALAKIGAVMVALNSLYKSSEAEFILNNSEVETVIVDEERLNVINEIRDKVPLLNKIILVGDKPKPNTLFFNELVKESSDDLTALNVPPEFPLVIGYTGGTTGFPKGAVMPHDSYLFAGTVAAARIHAYHERIVNVIPMSHTYVRLVQTLSILSGSTLIILERFYPNNPDYTLKVLSDYKATVFTVNTTIMAYLNAIPDEILKKYDINNLRIAVTGGAPLPWDIMKEFEKKFKTRVIEFYGLTETTPMVASWPIWLQPKPGSCGIPAEGVDVKIWNEKNEEVPRGEVGEIVVKGPLVMKEYWKNPDATKEAFLYGYFHTGDIGKMDEDNCLYVIDRKKDVILVGGFNVYPTEVESVIAAHPKVLECAVVGVPHEKLGEAPIAIVTLKPGEKATEEEIIEFCKTKLAAYKVPRRVFFRSELPHSTVGWKVLRRVLREEYKNSLKS